MEVCSGEHGYTIVVEIPADSIVETASGGDRHHRAQPIQNSSDGEIDTSGTRREEGTCVCFPPKNGNNKFRRRKRSLSR